MTTILTDSANYTAIANAIRTQLGVQTTYLPSEMADAILSISGGGGTVGPSTVTWANSTWEDIAAALAGHYAGDFDLTEYWDVGDTRSVSLSAMSATGVSESHSAQTVELVIMAAKHYDMSDNSGKAAFVIGQKDCLAETGYMNSTDETIGAWDACSRRTWCNNVYKSALPSDLQSLIKQVAIVTASNGGTYNPCPTTTSNDFCFVAAEKEVLGSNYNAASNGETTLSQYGWYSNGNKVKKLGTSGSAKAYWLRSPDMAYNSIFCAVSNNGIKDRDLSSDARNYGIAPCFCI